MSKTDALLVSPEECARRLGLPVSRVQKMVRAGELPAVRLSARTLRIPTTAIAAWVKQQTDAAKLADGPEVGA